MTKSVVVILLQINIIIAFITTITIVVFIIIIIIIIITIFLILSWWYDVKQIVSCTQTSERFQSPVETIIIMPSPYLLQVVETIIIMPSPYLQQVVETIIITPSPYLRRLAETIIITPSPYLLQVVETIIIMLSPYLLQVVKTIIITPSPYLRRLVVNCSNQSTGAASLQVNLQVKRVVCGEISVMGRQLQLCVVTDRTPLAQWDSVRSETRLSTAGTAPYRVLAICDVGFVPCCGLGPVARSRPRR